MGCFERRDRSDPQDFTHTFKESLSQLPPFLNRPSTVWLGRDEVPLSCSLWLAAGWGWYTVSLLTLTEYRAWTVERGAGKVSAPVRVGWGWPTGLCVTTSTITASTWWGQEWLLSWQLRGTEQIQSKGLYHRAALFPVLWQEKVGFSCCFLLVSTCAYVMAFSDTEAGVIQEDGKEGQRERREEGKEPRKLIAGASLKSWGPLPAWLLFPGIG